jgi:hypothetical protein
MKLIHQKIDLPIKNLDSVVGEELKSERKRHGILFPSSIRGIILGKSGCGKTNILINILLHENGLKFKNLYLYTKTQHQAKYQFLKKILNDIPQINFYIYNQNEQVIPVEKVKPHSIFIFDDIALEKQLIIQKYFCIARHFNIDIFLISQSIVNIQKSLCRNNANMIFSFRQDTSNIKHLFENFVEPDMNFQTFKEFCQLCWKEPYNFMVIDTESKINNGRYRCGLSDFLILNDNKNNK